MVLRLEAAHDLRTDQAGSADDNDLHDAAAVAAVTIRSCVSSGWETIATCPLSTSIVSAPMRCANCLSASGGITSSFSATRYHEGSDLHAGTPITSSNVDRCNGCCTAYMTLALTGSTSAAK